MRDGSFSHFSQAKSGKRNRPSFPFSSPPPQDPGRSIRDTPNLSPIDRVSAEYGVHISVSKELKDELAEMAFASGLGCRAVYSDLKRRLNDMMFVDCTQKSLIL